VRREDLRGALHNHTTASDGTASLAEMRAAASAWGLEYLGVSEHSEAAFYARGLDAIRLRAQRAEIADANARVAGPVLLTGVESDILDDGALDVPGDILAELEVVVASVHKRLGQGREAMTARLVCAVRSPWTDVLGHPTGRLLFGRPSADIDMETLLDACAEVGCAIELNGSPQRLDLAPAALAMAKERGVLVSIAADAHATSELCHLEHGIAVARHAGLRAEDVLNTRSVVELRAWLAARRARRGVAVAPSDPCP
jgi:DNA polymerase (family 10)